LRRTQSTGELAQARTSEYQRQSDGPFSDRPPGFQYEIVQMLPIRVFERLRQDSRAAFQFVAIVVLAACAPSEPPDSCRPFVISDEFVLAADRIALGSI
jgi:hypothetical protein